MSKLKHALGCLKDPKDRRDYPLTRIPPALKVKLPAKIDYAKKMSPVSNQGNEGTCVGFATVDGMKEYQEKAEWKKSVQLSVRYVYAGAQKIDGYPDEEEGTDIRSALKVLNKNGVPIEDGPGPSSWPRRATSVAHLRRRRNAGLTRRSRRTGLAPTRTSWPKST